MFLFLELEFPAGQILIYNYTFHFESGVEDQGYGKALLRGEAEAVITPGQSEHMIQVSFFSKDKVPFSHP